MRPRINTEFGTISFKEIVNYFNVNKVYNFTVEILDHSFVYSFWMRFRSNKMPPELIYVEVSKVTKNVVKAYSKTGRIFKTIKELKDYTRI